MDHSAVPPLRLFESWSRGLLLDCQSMTPEEAARFLRDFLDDYEEHARFMQEGFRSDPSPVRHAAAQIQADKLIRRLAPLSVLLRAAGVQPPHLTSTVPGTHPLMTFAVAVTNLRTAVMQAIGAFEHGLVTMAPEAAQEPPAPVTPEPTPLAVPAAPPPKPGYRERIENNLVWWTAAWLVTGLIAGLGAGLYLREGLDAAAARRAAKADAVKPPAEVARPGEATKPPDDARWGR